MYTLVVINYSWNLQIFWWWIWNKKRFFLDISKAFDRVNIEGFLFKLRINGISGGLLNIFPDFLSNRKQRVVLSGQTSSANITAGVRQGSVLGPLLFLVYINDLPDGITFLVNPFVPNASFLYSLKTSENRQGVEKGCIGNEWLKLFIRWRHICFLWFMILLPQQKN